MSLPVDASAQKAYHNALRLLPMKRPILRRLMYLGFQGLRGISRVLPLGAARGIGRALGMAAYHLLRAQRRLTLAHVQQAFKDTLSPFQRERVARGVFLNLGQNAMEWLRLSKCSPSDLQRLITGEGIGHLRDALAQGRGAIIVTAHFGNWELIPLYLTSLGFKGGVLARHLRYPEYESFFIALRKKRGVETYARGSLKEVANVLRANRIIGLLPDQDIDSLEGVFVDFFGHPAHTPVGPAALSLMTGAPILPCVLIRDGARFRLVIEPPIRHPQTTNRVEALQRITQQWSAALESYICRYPEQWVWMHRRWKTQSASVHRPPSTVHSRQERADSTQQTNLSQLQGVIHPRPVRSLLLLTAYCLLLTGCSKSATKTASSASSTTDAEKPNVTERMSEFTLTGYQQDGSKRWQLNGRGATIEDDVVTILQPDATGYDVARRAYLTASIAQVQQATRHVRMEHEVTIHTSDGLWLTSPVLHWIPDLDQMATDQPVRIETDHILLRGRGATGLAQLKQATLLEDIEMVLNPTEHELPAGEAKQVTITCDGPLLFDYEKHIATFEHHVHVNDPQGDLYSDRLVAYLDQATRTIRYAEATGHVTIQQQRNTATSERAVYEPAMGKITLVGRPSLLLYPSGPGAGSTMPRLFSDAAGAPPQPPTTASTQLPGDRSAPSTSSAAHPERSISSAATGIVVPK